MASRTQTDKAKRGILPMSLEKDEIIHNKMSHG